MRKIYLLLVSVVMTVMVNAQVTVTGADAVTNAGSPYTTLKGAFDNINLAAQAGNVIVISITGSTTELASAVLNAGTWTSITISPSGGVAQTISGAIAGHLIDLNGANNVTIDGLNTGGNALSIENSDGGSATSTIRFTNDASNNTIIRTNINGSAGATLGTGFGVVYFGTGTTTGNDNNLISTCNITNSSGGTPLNAIYSLGSSAIIDNSSNTITGCNISNFFSATTSSNGMNINSFNSGWTITNNALYQTVAPRTATSANTYNAINILSGVGYTISNNSIGGSNPSAGGTAWTLSGTIAVRFIGINIASTAGTANSIQNNTITNFALNTSSGATTTNGIWCGINCTGTGSANIGTITGNTIGATTGVNSVVATATTTGGLVVGIHSSTTGTVLIQNNTIGALSSSGTSAAIAGSITGVNISGAAASATISNNTIGNATANNMRGGTTGLTTGSSLVIGVNLPATPTIALINSNTIQNLTSFGTGTAGFVRGIDMQASGTVFSTNFTISSNTIASLTSNNALATLTNGRSSVTGIAFAGGTSGANVTQNIISNLSNSNTGALGTMVVGIGHANATNTNIFRNTIYGLSNASTATSVTAPGVVGGIFIRSGNGLINVYNNMISLGNAQTTNTAFVGIQSNFGSTPNATSVNVYYNSVNIEGVAAAGAQPSFGIARTDFGAVARTVPIDIRNNIITNTRTGGTGLHYAIANNFGVAAASAVGWGANASNYNVLNANAANVGWWTSAQTFAGWQTASASDASSLSGITVTYTAAATGDLHLNMGVTPTQLESGGTVIAGYTTDYDNQVRPGPAGSINGGAVAPDFGADEFDGVPLDLSAPAISYTPLTFTCGLGNRTLVATITDALSGVPTAGAGLPVLYWRINAGAYAPVTATSLGSNQYQFTFGAGVVASDVVSYYIVAQDGAGTPNVGAFPSAGAGGFTANPPAAATPPTTPSSYTVSTVLAAGTYNVGGAGVYLTLTAAINDYNTRCLGGPIVFELLDPVYAEAGAMTIIKHPDASAANTLTIRPAAGAIPTVSATVASGAILRILGNYVTIDGSNNGTSTRDLTLSNLSATAPSVVLIGSTGTSPITNVTLKNCNVINGAQTATAIMTSDAAVPGTAGYFNNITIDNNNVQRAFIGSYNIAVVSAGNGTGLMVTNNLMNTVGANSIRLVGIYVQGVDGATVSGNTIGNFDAAAAESDRGIWLATATTNSSVTNNTISNLGMTLTTAFTPTGINITSNVASANITVTGNTISGLSSAGGGAGVSTNGIFMGFATSNVTISKNQISNIKNTNASGWGANGILLSSSLTAANCEVSNNFVSDVAAFGFAAGGADDNGNGITITSGAGYNIYYNSVHLNTNQTAAGGLPAAFLATSGVTTIGAINLRNNIFYNSQTAGSTERYAIYSGAANTVYAAIDYNDYFTAGPNLGFIGGNRTALADIVTGFGGNTNSRNVLPVFVSATDLHLSNAAGVNCQLDGTATPIAGITTDIDNAARDAAAPDMGADEFASVPSASTLAATAGGGQVCSNVVVSGSGTSYKDASCNTIARVLPNGGSPVSGLVNTCVTIEASVLTYGGEAYVQRHFDITPAVNQSTATARVTLYVLQTEFDAFNAANGAYPDLPTVPGDAPGIANLRITKYSGNGTLPGTYSPGVATYINPADADIVWDAVNSWWAISFDVTGFSGFFIHTGLGVLPVSILNFSGYKDGNRNQLRWTTSSEQNNSGFEMQRSTDGVNYTALGFVNTLALGGNSTSLLNYAFTDNNVAGSKQYYRLRQVNFDGNSKLSNIVLIKGDKPLTLTIDGLFPNPANSMVNVLIATPNKDKVTLVVTDIAGRTVAQQVVSVETGSNTIPIDISRLTNGTYMVKLVCGSNCEGVVGKFVKQ